MSIYVVSSRLYHFASDSAVSAVSLCSQVCCEVGGVVDVAVFVTMDPCHERWMVHVIVNTCLDSQDQR